MTGAGAGTTAKAGVDADTKTNIAANFFMACPRCRAASEERSPRNLKSTHKLCHGKKLL
jgi:hypothetical protein